jgi:hypothetical protein
MEQKKKLIITVIVIPFIIGLVANFIYDKIKNHPYSNKGGFQVKFNIKVKFD